MSTPPPAINVMISPTSAIVFLGATQQFQAAVTDATNIAITWQVNGVVGGNAALGEISAAGLYTAPEILPSTPTISVIAVSVANDSASASATITATDNIVVTVLPASANVPAGGAQTFMASVSATGDPAQGVTWSVNSIAGGNATVGTIAPTGPTGAAIYMAPAIPPTPATVTIAATSVADTSKSGSASVMCAAGAGSQCTTPTVGTAFNPGLLPASQ